MATHSRHTPAHHRGPEDARWVTKSEFDAQTPTIPAKDPTRDRLQALLEDSELGESGARFVSDLLGSLERYGSLTVGQLARVTEIEERLEDRRDRQGRSGSRRYEGFGR